MIILSSLKRLFKKKKAQGDVFKISKFKSHFTMILYKETQQTWTFPEAETRKHEDFFITFLKNQQLVDNQKVDDSFSVTNQLTLLLSLKFALYTSPITMKAFYTKDFILWNVLLWFNSFYEIVTHVKPQVNVLYWKSIKRRSFPSQRRHERIFNHLTATSMFVWSCY